jgi:hypothetical protein
MKIHLIGRLAILAVCLIALGIFSLVYGTINNNQTVSRLGSLLVVLSAIFSSLPLLTSVIYSGIQKIRTLWEGQVSEQCVAFRAAPATKPCEEFWDIAHARTGETPYIQRRHFRRGNCIYIPQV